MQKNIVVGGGYLGTRLAKLLCQNDQEVITTHTSAKLASGDSIYLDINKTQSWNTLHHSLEIDRYRIFFLIPPSKINPMCLKDFVHFLTQHYVKRAILSSSTVVYGSRARIVDADSNIEIESIRAQRQSDIEQIWLNGGSRFRLIRLAGLYGPGRVIGAKALKAAQIIKSSKNGYLNLLHIDDAVTAIAAMMNSETANPIELACDELPVSRVDYYQEVARLLGTDKPTFAHQEPVSMRQCSNKPTCQRLNWKPFYSNYKTGLKQALNC